MTANDDNIPIFSPSASGPTPNSQGAGESSGGDTSATPIKDSDTAHFMKDVIEASMEGPVIVDFWAPWCGPCKQLGPALEKAVRGSTGVRLVKINIDENQQLAQQLHVQSVPTVYAFVNGQPVDGFTGALPESQVREFVARLGGESGPSPEDAALDEADAAFEAGEFALAGARYSQILAQAPENARARAGILRALVASGDLTRARQMADTIPEDQRQDAALLAALSALELAEEVAEAGDLEELEAALAAKPESKQARFDLAVALWGHGQQERAIETLLELVRRDRKWKDEAARKELLKFFEALGPTHPLTLSGRRGLSSILFS